MAVRDTMLLMKQNAILHDMHIEVCQTGHSMIPKSIRLLFFAICWCGTEREREWKV